MSDELQGLITMAHHDLQILGLRKKLKKIPVKVSEARKQLDAEQIMLDEVQGPWNQFEAEIKEKTATIEIALETITKFEEHMTRVTTQKEYIAAGKQIDEARRLNIRLQDEILEARVKLEEIEPRLKEVRSLYDKVREAFEDVEGGILHDKAALDAEIGQHEKKKSEAAAQVEMRTLNYYKKISGAGMVPALVEVVGGVCSGCNIALPPQVFNQLIASHNRYHVCEHCNRMIYYVPPAVEPKEESAQQAKVS